MKAVITISGIVLMVSGCLFAQNSEKGADQPIGISPDQRMEMLFNQIVRSIPEKCNTTADTVMNQTANGNKLPERTSTHETVRERRSEMTSALPDDLRKQVERAIEEIDLKKIEHSPSFIENRSGK